MLRGLECIQPAERIEVSRGRVSAWAVGAARATFHPRLATSTPEANQAPRRSQAETKCPRRGRPFRASPAPFQPSPVMPQKWSPRVRKAKGKRQSLRWGLQRSYLRIRLTPLFFSPEQKLLLSQGDSNAEAGRYVCITGVHPAHLVSLLAHPRGRFFACSFAV